MCIPGHIAAQSEAKVTMFVNLIDRNNVLKSCGRFLGKNPSNLSHLIGKIVTMLLLLL